jgi:hypothetical protein
MTHNNIFAIIQCNKFGSQLQIANVQDFKIKCFNFYHEKYIENIKASRDIEKTIISKRE